MSCALCSRGKFPSHAGCATCATCLNSVCTDSCRRPDGHSHGARCACGCPGTFCRPDLQDHVDDTHGGSVSNCFPSQGGLLGLQALGNALSAYYNQRSGERTPPKMRLAWNEFLNVVSPGSKALKATRLPPGQYQLETHQWEPTGKVRVEFSPSFFTEGTLERLAALAASEVKLAGSRGYTGEGAALPLPIGKRLVEVLRMHAERHDPALLSGAIRAPHGPARTRTLRWLQYVLSLDVPESSREVAAWLAGARAGSAALEPA
jgi:hypothetical protein